MDTAYTLYPTTCYRLEEWVKFNHDQFGLGYPKMSIEQMAVEGGGIDTRGSGLKISETPEHIQEIDDVLLELKARNPQHFYTIEVYFRTGSITSVFQKVEPRYRNRHRAREGITLAVAWVDGKIS